MPPVRPPANVAIVHEWLVDLGGSERVLEQILALFPQATLYTLIDRMAPADRGRFPATRVRTSFLDRLPRVQRYFARCLPLMPLAIQQFDLSEHDLVISNSHCVAKGALVSPDALHLCYCHSPMRYAWDMQGEYLRTEGLQSGMRSGLARLMLHGLRQWDAASAHRVDRFAANSRFVQHRIQKTYRRDAIVIHPPVEIRHPSTPSPPRRTRHVVTVGRLMGYKNVALMLDAMALLPEHTLTVVGTGPLLEPLRRQAPRNVTFTGHLPLAGLQDEVRRASAFLFAAVEDFGIAPVESLALGTPVIALARGGALDYLRHGDNAWLYEERTPRALADAIVAAEAQWPADIRQRCIASAGHFGAERFRQEFSTWVERSWADWQATDGPGCAPAPAP